MSSFIIVTCGVPQRSVLSPILFLIYINDLPDYIQNNSIVKRFADDTINYHPIINQQDSNALQEDLDTLQRWDCRAGSNYVIVIEIVIDYGQEFQNVYQRIFF